MSIFDTGTTSTPPIKGVGEPTLINTDLNAAIAALRELLRRQRNGTIPTQDKKDDQSPTSPNKPAEANCSGIIRDISYVQDMFLLGLTPMEDPHQVP